MVMILRCRHPLSVTCHDWIKQAPLGKHHRRSLFPRTYTTSLGGENTDATDAAPKRTTVSRRLSEQGRTSHRPATVSTTEHAETGENSEAFYKYYLNDTTIRPYRIPVSPWISDLDLEACRAALPAALRENPLLVFDRETNDVGLIKLCLETFIAKNHACNLDKPSTRRLFAEGRTGILALHWLTTRLDIYEKEANGSLIERVVHCMVAESADKHMREWLMVDHNASVQSPANPNTQTSLKGLIFLAFVQSKVFWSQDEAGIDEGLRAFLWAFDDVHSGHGILLTYAGLWLSRSLINAGHTISVDPSLYDRFLRSPRAWAQDLDDRELHTARLHLVHPICPPTLRFIRKNETRSNKSIFVNDLFQPRNGRTASLLFWFLIRLAQRLSRTGRQANAFYVLDFGRRTIPFYFRMQSTNEYKHLKAARGLRRGFLEAREHAQRPQ